MGVYTAIKNYTKNVELHLVMPAELPYGSEQPPNDLKKYLWIRWVRLRKETTFHRTGRKFDRKTMDLFI